MIVKHWQGYGSVNARVSGKNLNTMDNIETVEITVWGDHDYGLKCLDKYHVFNWLIVKLLKQYKKRDAYSTIKNIAFEFLPDIDGQEAGKYTIELKYWEDQ